MVRRANKEVGMTKGQLRGLVVRMISELDEIIGGEGERAAGRHELVECKEELQVLSEKLKPSRSGEIVSGSELLLVLGEVVQSLVAWVRKS